MTMGLVGKASNKLKAGLKISQLKKIMATLVIVKEEPVLFHLTYIVLNRSILRKTCD